MIHPPSSTVPQQATRAQALQHAPPEAAPRPPAPGWRPPSDGFEAAQWREPPPTLGGTRPPRTPAEAGNVMQRSLDALQALRGAPPERFMEGMRSMVQRMRAALPQLGAAARQVGNAVQSFEKALQAWDRRTGANGQLNMGCVSDAVRYGAMGASQLTNAAATVAQAVGAQHPAVGVVRNVSSWLTSALQMIPDQCR